MAEGVQLVFRESPGSLPASYEITGGGELLLTSVFTRIDGSGAAGSFVPCLDILSQDGKIISRVAVTQTLAAGDLARVTWAPFLRRQAASSTPVTGYPFQLDTAGLQTLAGIAVPDSTWTELTGWTGAFSDGSDTYVKTAAGPNRFQIAGTSMVAFSGWIEWAAGFTGDRKVRLGPNGFLVPSTDDFLTVDLGQTGDSNFYSVDFVVAGSAAVFRDISIEVWQNSGAGQTVQGEVTHQLWLVGLSVS